MLCELQCVCILSVLVRGLLSCITRSSNYAASKSLAAASHNNYYLHHPGLIVHSAQLPSTPLIAHTSTQVTLPTPQRQIAPSAKAKLHNWLADAILLSRRNARVDATPCTTMNKRIRKDARNTQQHRHVFQPVHSPPFMREKVLGTLSIDCYIAYRRSMDSFPLKSNKKGLNPCHPPSPQNADKVIMQTPFTPLPSSARPSGSNLFLKSRRPITLPMRRRRPMAFGRRLMILAIRGIGGTHIVLCVWAVLGVWRGVSRTHALHLADGGFAGHGLGVVVGLSDLGGVALVFPRGCAAEISG